MGLRPVKTPPLGAEGQAEATFHVPDAVVDEVVAHLVSLRGGGLFLSPTDGELLLRWLGEGVRPAQLLLALERAAEARRARRSRLPLTLGQAARYLRPARPAALGDPARPRWEPPAHSPEAALWDHLAAAPGEPEEQLRWALSEVRSFLAAQLSSLDPSERRALQERALADLGDLVDRIPEATRDKLVEEGIRDLLRQRFPRLTAASLADRYGAWGLDD